MSVIASQMPPVKRAAANGLDMAYYEVGARAGVPVVFCHGFPEVAFSWRHQLRAFEAAGRWAIAPDQRGYGLTKGPQAVAEYDMEHLTGDLVGLLDHLEVEKAVFCGHDWGGFVVWQMALRRPDRCAGIIGLNTPFLKRYPIDPVDLFRREFGEDMYVIHFQKPGEADALFAQDVERTVRCFMRLATGRPSRSGFALHETLKRFDKARMTGQFLTADEIAVFVEMFEVSGFTGPINWYRNFSRNWERSAHLPERIDNLPCLMVMAQNDAVLPPAMADGMEDRIGDLEKVLIEDCGHWTQQEKPQEVNAIILDWMERRFPR